MNCIKMNQNILVVMYIAGNIVSIITVDIVWFAASFIGVLGR